MCVFYPGPENRKQSPTVCKRIWSFSGLPGPPRSTPVVQGSGADIPIKNHNNIKEKAGKQSSVQHSEDEFISRNSSGHRSLPYPPVGACADPGNAVGSLYLDKGMAHAPHFSWNIQVGSGRCQPHELKTELSTIQESGRWPIESILPGKELWWETVNGPWSVRGIIESWPWTAALERKAGLFSDGTKSRGVGTNI